MRKDHITLTLILLVEKYKLSQKIIFIDYNNLKNDIKNTISFIRGKIIINIIKEIFYCLDKLNLKANMELVTLNLMKKKIILI